MIKATIIYQPGHDFYVAIIGALARELHDLLEESFDQGWAQKSSINRQVKKGPVEVRKTNPLSVQMPDIFIEVLAHINDDRRDAFHEWNTAFSKKVRDFLVQSPLGALQVSGTTIIRLAEKHDISIARL